MIIGGVEVVEYVWEEMRLRGTEDRGVEGGEKKSVQRG